MNHKIITFILIILLFSSCSSYPIKYAPYKFDGTKNTGLLIGTISIVDKGKKYRHYDFYFHRDDQPNKRRNVIRVSPDQTFLTKFKPDFVRGDTMVFQYVFERQPGNYEFTDYELFINKGIWQSYTKSKHGISIPFEIKPKEISYLGDIVLNTKGIIGDELIHWMDHFARDKQRFIDRFPHYHWDNLTNRTIKSGHIAGASIEFVE